MAKVKAENPELSEADLMVQVSDCVKQAEAARKGQAAERLNEFPCEMLADQLVHRPGLPRIPPLQGAGAEQPRCVDDFPNYYKFFGREPPLPEEIEEEDHEVIRRPERYPGHAKSHPFPPPHPRQRPNLPWPSPGFVCNHETAFFDHLWRPWAFDPRNNTLFDYHMGVFEDLHTGQMYQVHPPRYRDHELRLVRRHHPNDHY